MIMQSDKKKQKKTAKQFDKLPKYKDFEIEIKKYRI